jgi:hypothetical protein
MQRAFLFFNFYPSCHETAIQDRFVFFPKAAVTPAFELIDLICYQDPDSFSQLFFE